MVNIKEKEEERKETPIHPLVKEEKTTRPSIAGVLLIIVFLLGIFMGISILLFQNEIFKGEGNYKARILDEGRNPLSNVSVYLDEQLVTKSNENGEFFLYNVSAGKHDLILEKEGYNKIRVKILILPFASSLFTDVFIMEKGNETREVKTLLFKAFEFLPYISFAIIIVSIPPLIGGIFCFLRKQLTISLIGAVLGIFSIGFFIGSLLSIVALILIWLSRDEFD